MPAAVAAGAEWLLVEQDEVDGSELEAAARSLGALEGIAGRLHERLARSGSSVAASSAASTPERAGVRRVRGRRLRRPRPSAQRGAGGGAGLAVAAVDELIADPTIDIVLNLTPPAVHVAVIAAALAAGKHVYTEKPLATSSPKAAALIAEAGGAGSGSGARRTSSLAAPTRPLAR